MKLRYLASILIFVSSYFPLAIIVLIKDLNDSTFLPQHLSAAIGIIVIFSFACFVVLVAAKTIRSGLPAVVVKSSNKSGDMFTYTIPYMVSFYRFDLGDWKAIASISVFMLLMYFLTLRMQNQFVNPVLALAGYKLFDCTFNMNSKEYQGLIISRKVINNGDTLIIEQLSEMLYLATPKKYDGA